MSKYLSFIFAARNDDYAPGFISRFQNSINYLCHFAKKHFFSNDIEILIAEWNPLPNKKLLAEVLAFPKGVDFRIIQIPNELHKKVKATQFDAENPEKIPFYEFHAKNVAGRRADGQFLLFTTADILFNDELISFLAKKKLSQKHFYRIDRKDFLEPINPNITPEIQINKSKNHIDQRLVEKNKGCRLRHVHSKASGDFLLIPKEVFLSMKGYVEIRTSGAAIDRFGLYCARTICPQIILDDPMCIYHQPHQDREEIFKSGKFYSTEHLTFNNPIIKKWFKDAIHEMEKFGKNKNINDNEWGLNHNKLKEIKI